MNHLIRLAIPVLIFVCGLTIGFKTESQSSGATLTVTISGGHETVPADRGRPVKLIAAALGVKDQVFRDAFSHVHPAPAGQAPDPRQVALNKQALLEALAPYGITNDHLDEVSNFYRYRPGRGNLWKYEDAEISITLNKGEVTKITIIKSGYGYSSVPTLSVPGHPEIKLTAKLNYSQELSKNGSISKAALSPTSDTN